MPRPKKRDLRKRYLSLYRFIETELTDENYLTLTLDAARVMLQFETSPVEPRPEPPGKRATISREKGAARYVGVESDLDLDGALVLQERFRSDLAAIKAGDTSPAHTSISRLIDSRFDRLKRILTRPPRYVHEVMIGTVLAHSIGDAVYTELVERTCTATGCNRTFQVPPGSNKRTCGDRSCRIDADNIRRKQRRTITTART